MYYLHTKWLELLREDETKDFVLIDPIFELLEIIKVTSHAYDKINDTDKALSATCNE